MKKVTVILMLLFTFVLFGGIKLVHATPILQLYDGSSTLNIEDNSALDQSLDAGVIVYIGTLGSFKINVTTGITLPAVGTLTLPEIDLNSVNVTSTGGGELTISFTEIGFGPLALPGFSSSVGGTTDGIASFNTYVDSTNAYFGTGTLLASLGPFTVPFSAELNTLVTPSTPFSMTVVADITHAGAGDTTSFDLNVNPVPEPGTLMLLGSGLMGIGVYRWRRMRKK